MAKADFEYNNFAAGVTTEASEINYPQQALKACWNFERQRNGAAHRRPPLQAEVNTPTLFTVPATTSSVREPRTHTWASPDGSSTVDVVLMQYGETFAVYKRNKGVGSSWTDITPSAASISDLGQKGSAPSAYGVRTTTSGGAITKVTDLNFTSSGKWAVITGLEFTIGATTYYDMVLILEYDSDAGTITSWYDWLWTRDFWGVRDTLKSDSASVTAANLTAEIAYNLFNQGWYTNNNDSSGSGYGNWNIRAYLLAVGRYPSKDKWYSLGVVPDATGNKFGPNFITTSPAQLGGAPVGHYVIPATRRDLTTIGSTSVGRGIFEDDFDDVFSGLSGSTVPTDVEAAGYSNTLGNDKSGRPAACTSFAGRFWYGMTTDRAPNNPDGAAPDIQTLVFFSKTLTNKDSITRCYQANDPTSTEISDILADDGGFIRIDGMSGFKGFSSIGQYLLVVAENGVWAVSGDGDAGFSATSYQVRKITNAGCASDQSILSVQDSVMWFSTSGLEAVYPNQYGQLEYKNLSDSTIKTWIDDNVLDFSTIVGVYDVVYNKARWLVDYTTGAYTKELVLDTVLGGFEMNEYNVGTTESLIGYIQLPSDTRLAFSNSVRADGFLFLFKNVSTRVISTGQLRRDDPYSFAHEDIDGDAEGYIDVATMTGGDTQRNKRVTYIHTHFKRTEDTYTIDGNGVVTLDNQSGCYLEVFFDYADSDTSTLKTATQQAYRFRRPYLATGGAGTYTYDYGQSVISTKNKVRGAGKALRIRFTTEAGKDCKILGWAAEFNANNRP